MFEELKEFVKRGDVAAVAAGLLIALVGWQLLEAFVGALVAPFIALFVGDSVFSLNSFTIQSTEFVYGSLLQELITFVIALVAVYFAVIGPLRSEQVRAGLPVETRPCPECTSTISVAAKRCPHCTASVAPTGTA